MSKEIIPRKIIEADHRLERAAESSAAQLAELRWRWTKDETNAQRVTVGAYAAAVGRRPEAIRVMALGYAEWKNPVRVANDRSLNDCIELAKLGAEAQAATVAVAKALGKSPGNVASSERGTVRGVLANARDAAERKGTSVGEEIPRAAASIAKTRAVEAKTRSERKARYGLRYVQIDGKILTAKRHLTEALELADDIADEEERELLRDAIANLVALTHLIDLRLGGAPDIDWNAELVKLGGN